MRGRVLYKTNNAQRGHLNRHDKRGLRPWRLGSKHDITSHVMVSACEGDAIMHLHILQPQLLMANVYFATMQAQHLAIKRPFMLVCRLLLLTGFLLERCTWAATLAFKPTQFLRLPQNQMASRHPTYNKALLKWYRIIFSRFRRSISIKLVRSKSGESVISWKTPGPNDLLQPII